MQPDPSVYKSSVATGNITVELRRCNQEPMTLKVENFYYLAHYQKCLLTPVINGTLRTYIPAFQAGVLPSICFFHF